MLQLLHGLNTCFQIQTRPLIKAYEAYALGHMYVYHFGGHTLDVVTREAG